MNKATLRTYFLLQVCVYALYIHLFILKFIIAIFIMSLPCGILQGAFVGLVVGLFVGIIRMGLEWSRSGVPCGDPTPSTAFKVVTEV